MASTTTMNGWMEQLALSLIPPASKSTDIRKYKDLFTRRVKHHNYGRTNQFAVAEKLTGLEEKFQVLNLDDLAEALYVRRMELNTREDRWLPDVLDLLLHLSDDPVKNSRVDDLENCQPRPETPAPLKWADIEVEDPIDHQDRIWSIPDYSDFSSDAEEDEVAVSSITTSPASVKQGRLKAAGLERAFTETDAGEKVESPSNLEAAQFWRESGQSVTVTEKQATREVLFMLGGLPTSIFTSYSGGIRPNHRYRLGHLEHNTSASLLDEAASIGSEIECVRRWLRIHQNVNLMQLVQSGVRDIVTTFECGLSQIQNDILHEDAPTGVVSLLQTLQTVRNQSRSFKGIAAVTSRITHNDSISALNALYDHLDLTYACGQSASLEMLFPTLLSALELYAKPIDGWLQTGKLEPTELFFISESKQPRDVTTLWHNWFLVSEDDKLVPSFLRKFVEQIFAAGKTAAFLRHLGHMVTVEDRRESLGIGLASAETAQLIEDSPLPFSATLELVLDQHLNDLLVTSTTALKDILEAHCGLSRLLDAFDYLYLGKNGAILDIIESRMFDQIDRCVEMWNDRFLLLDVLAEAYLDVECVESDSISVHATYTSSRAMESRRRSVSILSRVTLSYHLPWPIANIILPASIAAYQRIALTLCQIRRAKAMLGGRAYFCVQNVPLGTHASDQKVARAMHMALWHFVNVLYAHVTTCTIEPLTQNMRTQLGAPATGSVDEMIAVHTRYMQNLEHACLSSQRIKPLRDALLAILDLCIRFADLVSSPASAKHRAARDLEADSFISARSQRRQRRRVNNSQDEESSSSDEDKDEDDDEDGAGADGYSTFILDEDTSVMQEIGKVRGAFVKHAEFLLAGLRAVARTSGDVGNGLELLADTLEGVFPKKRHASY